MTDKHHSARVRIVRPFATVASVALLVFTGLGISAFVGPAAANSATRAAPSPGSLGAAEAVVREKGYRPYSNAGWDGPSTLKVILGTVSISVDGYSNRAFFFANGNFVGTDTSTDSAGITALGAVGDTVTLSYQLYNPADPMCCPTASTATVRYHWTGSGLVPLDKVPSPDWAAIPSRR
ncbi:LppP/LprE family lipoprotein [Amycolatopsis pigmentata]|uniref:LppP/LprE family lipoprotein n=1 Tax=Amycolatopsis pigmentata TaxID=450801 RepID=A0ABW5G493_9PSEU